MLAFVIPLKSEQVSTSWEHVSKLFERCVKSVCNQTSPEFRVIVVCHEKPQIEFSHPHITYLKVDFPAPEKSSGINPKHTDKGRKILAGLSYAKNFTPSHSMVVDADDCISKKLAKFVKKNPDINGWLINKGYKYQEGSKYIYVKKRKFYKMCGTCNIIRYDLNDLPEEPEFNRGYGYYKYFIDRQKVKGKQEQKGTPLKLLPFAGAVYMIENSENIYASQSRLIFNFVNRRVLTPSICDEFGIYQLNKFGKD